MTNHEPTESVARRAAALSLAAVLAACAHAPQPPVASTTTTTTTDTAARTEDTHVNNRILIAMTSHDKMGSFERATGAFLTEVSHPYAVFVKAGYTVDFASVQGGKVPWDEMGLDRKDAVNATFMDDPQLMRRVSETIAASAVDPARYAAIFFAGGWGAMWDFPDNTAFARAAMTIYEANGIVGAVCHGPAALVNLQMTDGTYLVAGKAVSAFTNEEERAIKF